MNNINTAPQGEASSTDLLANRALIEKIVAQQVLNIPAQVAAQMAHVHGLIETSGDEGVVGNMLHKLLQFTQEEFDSIKGIHDTLVEALLPFQEQTDLLSLMDIVSRPEVAAALLLVQKSIMEAMNPFVLEAGERVGKRLVAELDKPSLPESRIGF